MPTWSEMTYGTSYKQNNNKPSKKKKDDDKKKKQQNKSKVTTTSDSNKKQSNVNNWNPKQSKVDKVTQPSKSFNSLKSTSATNVKDLTNSVGANAPKIKTISPDKSKDTSTKSTATNNKVVINPKHKGKVWSGDGIHYYYSDDFGQQRLIDNYDPTKDDFKFNTVFETTTDDNLYTITNPTKRDYSYIKEKENEVISEGYNKANPYDRIRMAKETGQSIDMVQAKAKQDTALERELKAQEKANNPREVNNLLDGALSIGDEFIDGVANGTINLVQGVGDVVSAVPNYIFGELLGNDGYKENYLATQKALNSVNDAINNLVEYEHMDGIGGVAQDVSNAIGGMTPMLLGGAYGGPLVANTILGASAYGGGLNEALQETDDLTKARLYGGANALTEVLIEKIMGGIPTLGKGALDNLVNSIVGRIGSDGLQSLAKLGINSLGEGAEEYLSSVIGEFTKDIYQGNDGKGSFVERLGNVQGEALNSALLGSIVGGLLGGGQAYSEYRANKRNNVDNQSKVQITDGVDMDYFNSLGKNDEAVEPVLEPNTEQNVVNEELQGKVENVENTIDNNVTIKEIEANKEYTSEESKAIIDEATDLTKDVANRDELKEEITSNNQLSTEAFLEKTGDENNALYDVEDNDNTVSFDNENVEDVNNETQQVDNYGFQSDAIESNTPFADRYGYASNMSTKTAEIVKNTNTLEDVGNFLIDRLDINYDDINYELNSLYKDFTHNKGYLSDKNLMDFAENLANKNEVEDYDTAYDWLLSNKDSLNHMFSNVYGKVKAKSTGKVKTKDNKTIIPKQVKGKKISQTVTSVINSESLKKTPELRQSLQTKSIQDALGSYEPTNWEKVLNKANKIVFDDRFNKTIDGKKLNDAETIRNFAEQFVMGSDNYTNFKKDNNLNLSDEISVGNVVINELSNMYSQIDDVQQKSHIEDLITDVALKYTKMGSEAGKALNLIKMLKEKLPNRAYQKAKIKLAWQYINTIESMYSNEKKIVKNNGKFRDNISQDLMDLINNEQSYKYTEEQWEYIYNQIVQESLNYGKHFSVMNTLRTWRYMSMLYNPKTWIRNYVGNTANYGFHAVSDTLGWAIESANSNLFKSKSPRQFVNPMNRNKDIYNRVKGWVKDGTITMDTTSRSIMNEIEMRAEALKKQDLKTSNIFLKGANAVGKAVNKTQDLMLDKSDAFFSSKKYTSSLSDFIQANKIDLDLAEYVFKTGLFPRNGATINGKHYSYYDLLNASELLYKGKANAQQRAEKIVYREKNAVADWMEKAKRSDKKSIRAIGKIMDINFPFKRTPFNITKQMILEDSPIGVYTGLKNLFSSKSDVDTYQAIEQLSTGLTGTGLIAIGGMLFAQGFLTGNGNDMDDKEREIAEKRGWKPYALKIGNEYHTIDWLSPTSVPLVFGAQLMDIAQSNTLAIDVQDNGQTSDFDILGNVLSLFESSVSPALEMSSLSGLTNNLPQSYEYETTAEFMSEYAKNLASNFATQMLSPQIVTNITKAFKPEIKTVSGMGDDTSKFIANITKNNPLTKDSVTNSFDLRGNVRMYEGNTLGERLLNNVIKPFNSTEYQDDKTIDELLTIYDEIGNGEVLPFTKMESKVTYGKKRNGKDNSYQLVGQDFETFNSNARKTFFNEVEKFMQSPIYQGLSNDKKSTVVGKLKSYSRDRAKEEFFNNNKDLNVAYSSDYINRVERMGVEPYMAFLVDSGATKNEIIQQMHDLGADEETIKSYIVDGKGYKWNNEAIEFYNSLQ